MQSLNVHAMLAVSEANGPGRRAVVWLQGCSRHCPGCANPDTWSHEARQVVAAAALAEKLLVDPGIEGVTITGGEPLDQASGLLALVQALRARERALIAAGRRPRRPGLSLLLFSGLTRPTIARRPLGPAILRHLDVLIAGPFRQDRIRPRGLLASANQRLHLLSRRHHRAELLVVPPLEIVLDLGGGLAMTGMAVPAANHAVRRRLASLGVVVQGLD